MSIDLVLLIIGMLLLFKGLIDLKFIFLNKLSSGFNGKDVDDHKVKRVVRRSIILITAGVVVLLICLIKRKFFNNG